MGCADTNLSVTDGVSPNVHVAVPKSFQFVKSSVLWVQSRTLFSPRHSDFSNLKSWVLLHMEILYHRHLGFVTYGGIGTSNGGFIIKGK